jgi:hypothetical protein
VFESVSAAKQIPPRMAERKNTAQKILQEHIAATAAWQGVSALIIQFSTEKFCAVVQPFFTSGLWLHYLLPHRRNYQPAVVHNALNKQESPSPLQQ